MSSYQYRRSHYKDKTLSWLSYLYKVNAHTWIDSFHIETGPGIAVCPCHMGVPRWRIQYVYNICTFTCYTKFIIITIVLKSHFYAKLLNNLTFPCTKNLDFIYHEKFIVPHSNCDRISPDDLIHWKFQNLRIFFEQDCGISIANALELP